MATSVSDDIQHEELEEPLAIAGWHSLPRAEVLWTLFGLTLLVAFLYLAAARG